MEELVNSFYSVTLGDQDAKVRKIFIHKTRNITSGC